MTNSDLVLWESNSLYEGPEGQSYQKDEVGGKTSGTGFRKEDRRGGGMGGRKIYQKNPSSIRRLGI